MRRYGPCSGTKDADVPPNQERALPIGLKNSGIIRSERIFIKTVEHAGGQPAADVRDLFPVQDGPGDPGDLRRKSTLGLTDVDPHSDNGIPEHAGLTVDTGLCQNAADLLLPDEDVVDPLDPGGTAGELLNGTRNSHGRAGRHTHGLRRRDGRAEEKAEIKPRAGRGAEASPHAAAARRLMLCHQSEIRARAVGGKRLEHGIR